MTPVVTLSLPDPSALSYRERADLRTQAADQWRQETGSGEDVGVDIVTAGSA